jgi:hypothetical protein
MMDTQYISEQFARLGITQIDQLIGKKPLNEEGHSGEIIAYSKDCRLVQVRWFDGIDADPTEPTFPVYERVLLLHEIVLSD